MSVAKRTRSAATLDNNLDNTVNGNRKKEQKFDQIFKGLRFLLLPNREKAASTQARVEAYEKRGASCVHHMDKNVTHILVPKNWTRETVKRQLDITDVDDKVKVLTNDWVTKCIDEDKYVDDKGYQIARGEENEREEKGEEKEDEKIKSEKNEREKPGDDLDHAIELYKVQADASELLSDNEPESDDDEDEEGKDYKSKLKGDWQGFLAKKKKQDEQNPNHRAIAIFTLMMQHYQDIGEEYRKMAYRRAVSTLEDCNKPITTAKQAKELSGIGESLASKIEEISKTGKLQKLEVAEESDMGDVMAKFKRIYGVGTKTAHSWYQEGLRTYDDVKKRNDLTQSQRVGLEHVEDFNQLISRSTVEKHAEIVNKAVKELDNKIDSYLMGSYRRGAEKIGDIDFIFTKEGASMDELKEFQSKLVEKLEKEGFMKVRLSGEKATRFMGASKIESEERLCRIDFLLVADEELGAAMIYYTGNDLFNRSLRLLAIRKQLRLTNRGLYKEPYGHRDPNREPSKEYLIESRDERKIFEKLGVPYRKPEERNVG